MNWFILKLLQAYNQSCIAVRMTCFRSYLVQHFKHTCCMSNRGVVWLLLHSITPVDGAQLCRLRAESCSAPAAARFSVQCPDLKLLNQQTSSTVLLLRLVTASSQLHIRADCSLGAADLKPIKCGPELDNMHTTVKQQRMRETPLCVIHLRVIVDPTLLWALVFACIVSNSSHWVWLAL